MQRLLHHALLSCNQDRQALQEKVAIKKKGAPIQGAPS
jgi:hypothetical protein